jgi:peptidyl-prolyl cis-trans isomerase D
MSPFQKYIRAIVLTVMFGMLIISFGLWGIGDMLRMGHSDSVIAEVGGTKITSRQVRERFDRMLQQYQARTGRALTVQQGVQSGLHWRAVEESIKAAVIDRAAQEMGIAISDDQIRQAIAQIPGFWGSTGKFEQSAYQSALQRAGLSEATFVADLRRELAANQMLGVAQGAARPPTALRDALYKYRREKRVAELFVLPFESVRDVPTPTAEQLQAHLDANKERFTVKEFRGLSYVLLTLDDVLGEVQISEDQVRQSYNDRLGEFTQPERRDLDQIVVATEDEAKKIAELVKGGKSLEDAGKEVLNREAVIKLGSMTKKDLVGQLADGAFGLAEGATGGPYQSPLGWHVVRINKIEAGSTPSFEALRARIEQDLRKEAAPDILYKRVRELDQALSRSDSLADAAKAVGADVRVVEAVNDQGATQTGSRAMAEPAAQEIVRTAFTLREGQQSALIDTPQGDSFVVRVDRVIPARLPPLSEIEALVKADWQRAERQRLAEARAKDIVTRLNAVADFESQARALGQQIRVSKPLDRFSVDRDSLMSAELVADLFALEPGRSTSHTIENGVAILRLKELIAADPAKAAEDAKQFSTEVGNSMSADLIQSMLSGFEQRYGRRVDMQALEQLFRSSDQQ